jgi:hypothetical protein
VTIDGSGIALPNDLVGLFHVTGKEYIRVSGLRVINARPNNDNAGIMVLDSSNIIVIIDYNLIDGYRDRGDEGETRGNDYVEGDPRFFNAAGASFYLQADSPTIDAGSALDAPNTDFDGRPRPLDGDGDGTAFTENLPFLASTWLCVRISETAPTTLSPSILTTIPHANEPRLTTSVSRRAVAGPSTSPQIQP